MSTQAAGRHSEDGVDDDVDDAELDADAAEEPSQGSQWADCPRDRVHTLIVQQIPSYSSRPYIRDRRELRQKLADGLERKLRGDFCWSLSFAPLFIERLCYEGFLPICTEIAGGTGLYVLLPKLHMRRCILEFANLHVGKSTRKRAGNFSLSVNTAFDRVVSGCIAQHGEDWLHPPMRSVLTTLFGRARARAVAPAAALGVAEGAGATPGGGPPHTAMASFELWDASGELVAGEIGCVNGQCYTSFSGFHSPAASGSGTVQLVLTARVLQRARFAFWDLGQEFEYKTQLGASVLGRAQFLERFRAARAQANDLAAVSEVRARLPLTSTRSNGWQPLGAPPLTRSTLGAAHSPPVATFRPGMRAHRIRRSCSRLSCCDHMRTNMRLLTPRAPE